MSNLVARTGSLCAATTTLRPRFRQRDPLRTNSDWGPVLDRGHLSPRVGGDIQPRERIDLVGVELRRGLAVSGIELTRGAAES